MKNTIKMLTILNILNLCLYNAYGADNIITTNKDQIEKININKKENSKILEEKSISLTSKHLPKDKLNDSIQKRKKFETHPKYQNEDDWYQDFKNALEKQYNTSYSFDLTYMPQRGAPNGEETAQQIIFSPYLSISPFTDTFVGSGQIQLSYSGIRYWNEEAENIQNRINVGSGINDYPTKSNQFSQLLYTHTMPNSMKWLSVNVGQYSIYFIDGTSQDYNQQSGFISYSLSQNGSASYPVASLGGYLQFTPTSEWMMQVGFQDANNVSGNKINFKSLDDGEYTTFVYFSWSPTFKNSWIGQYILLSYDQPSTLNQVGDSKGWSFSFSQYLGNVFNIFGRINGSTGNVVPIKKSFVLGSGFKDPFKRNSNDYIGFSFGINQMSAISLGQTAIHKYENVIEGQYIIGIGKYFTITPDIQFFVNPALDTNASTATVISLRMGISI